MTPERRAEKAMIGVITDAGNFPIQRAIDAAADAIRVAVNEALERAAAAVQSTDEEGDYYPDEEGEEHWEGSVSRTLERAAANVRALKETPP